ncbi:MAG: hypothetical protein J6V52_04240 [Bacteroidaceae bacterium]|nr:hypothetical protein [Bacteroidaceae bacterium]
MAAAKSFLVYLDYAKAVEWLSDEDAGKIFKALLAYADNREEPQLDGGLRAVFAMMQNQIDRDREKYEETCEKRRANGEKGGRPPKAKAQSENQTKPNGFSEKQTKHDTDTDTEKDTETDIEKESKKEKAPDKPTRTRSVARTARGVYGWVKLSDEEYSRLSNELGEHELKRCIAYVDESAQSTNNKNGWRDWNLVIRKCSRDGWGLKPKAPASAARGPVTRTAADDMGEMERRMVRRMMEKSHEIGD